MPTVALGCCCSGDEGDPCDATIRICPLCPDNPITVTITGATVTVGDITPATPYGACIDYTVQLPHDSAEVTITVSGTGFNTTTIENATINCGDIVTVHAANTPTAIMATTCVYTLDAYHDELCPVEGASVEHTGCCTGTTGMTDSEGCVTLALDQTGDCGDIGDGVTVSPPGGYGAAARTVDGPCPSCDDTTGPQEVIVYPDTGYIGHGTYFSNEMELGFMCSGRYLPYTGATYTDDDGSCSLAFIEVADLPPEYSDVCIEGAPIGAWVGSFSFAPLRIGTPVAGEYCEGIPNCLATDNDDELLVLARVIVWVVGSCDGATVYVRRCSEALELPTNCLFIDSECVYSSGLDPCLSAYELPEVLGDNAATTCTGGSMTASGTATVVAGICTTGRVVDWEVTCPI